MLFFLHVVGVEGLHGVGFELVVAVEGRVEAERTAGGPEKLLLTCQSSFLYYKNMREGGLCSSLPICRPSGA